MDRTVIGVSDSDSEDRAQESCVCDARIHSLCDLFSTDVLPDPTNTAGPFGYGFYQDTTIEPASAADARPRVPSSFYFRGVTGWTSQEFQHFMPVKPQASVFDVPAQCVNAPNCGIMN